MSSTTASPNVWLTCDKKVHKAQIVFAVQVIIAFVVILVCLLNLTFYDENVCLWSTLLSAIIGYLLPNPKIPRE